MGAFIVPRDPDDQGTQDLYSTAPAGGRSRRIGRMDAGEDYVEIYVHTDKSHHRCPKREMVGAVAWDDHQLVEDLVTHYGATNGRSPTQVRQDLHDIVTSGRTRPDQTEDADGTPPRRRRRIRPA